MILAAEYKMPESEFKERFSIEEITRIQMLNSARFEADKIRHPELYNKK